MIKWIPEQAILVIHAELLREHGGLSGTVNQTALGSTLARPQNLLAYNEECSIAELSACYGFGFAKNHCFTDGNKRMALSTVSIFLHMNGYQLTASEPDAVATILDIASGEQDENDLVIWIEQNMADL